MGGAPFDGHVILLSGLILCLCVERVGMVSFAGVVGSVDIQGGDIVVVWVVGCGVFRAADRQRLGHLHVAIGTEGKQSQKDEGLKFRHCCRMI